MQCFYSHGVIFLMALMPISTSAYGSTAESIIDSILRDAPDYLTANAEKTGVQAVDSVVRSCPFLVNQILLRGETIYTLAICLNATGLKIKPPSLVSFTHFCLIDGISHPSNLLHSTKSLCTFIDTARITDYASAARK
ncbi:unnamed protein product [Hydatigera taeniaeformis]|uniref:Secreted protein n=1 Tax=Hydatigena taeniaeformis TaxID=6205 RepID=A0A0R3X6N3_HYDTA|nr:unnamed protein product [Hydatigera taeniaeformis]